MIPCPYVTRAATAVTATWLSTLESDPMGSQKYREKVPRWSRLDDSPPGQALTWRGAGVGRVPVGPPIPRAALRIADNTQLIGSFGR